MRTEASQQRPDTVRTGALHVGLLQRQCACGGTSNLTGACSECEKKKMLGHSLQTKLRVNEPGDQFEQEADRVAAQVMRMPDASAQAQPLQSEPVIQRFVEDSGRQTGEGTMQRADEAGKESAPAGEQSASGGRRLRMALSTTVEAVARAGGPTPKASANGPLRIMSSTTSRRRHRQRWRKSGANRPSPTAITAASSISATGW